MQNVIKTFFASASELQSSDLYMTIKSTLFTVPSANLNGVRCTEAFLDEIVEHQDKYIGLPLCADTVNLVKGRYSKLGHCYNPKTGTYSSSIIGSFYRFEKEELENGEMALIGYARVMKRNKRVCAAIGELFASGALKFSFEISCGSYTELDDKTLLIDAAENNYIEGMCIVSFPACPDAVALELVAEINGIRKEADDMENIIESAEVDMDEVENTPTVPEAEPSAENDGQETVIAEAEVGSEEEPATEESEHQASDNEATDQNAEVTVTTEIHTYESVSVHDSESETIVTETNTHAIYTVEKLDNESDEVQVAQEEAQNAEHAEAEPAEVQKDVAPDFMKAISELQAELNALREELSELRTQKVAAEAEHAAVTINPFVAEISAPKKYMLLESEKRSVSNSAYSLLDKA